jgi:hypothetical protein
MTPCRYRTDKRYTLTLYIVTEKDVGACKDPLSMISCSIRQVGGEIHTNVSYALELYITFDSVYPCFDLQTALRLKSNI